MTTGNGPAPRIIPVGQEPPRMDPPTPREDRRPRANRPKGQPSTGRFQTINAFADSSLAHLGRAEIAVWLLLWRDTRDGTVLASMSSLAQRAGCSRRQVVRAMSRLESLGLVAVVRRGGFRQGASRYRVRPLTKDP